MKKSRKLTISVARTREVDAESVTIACSARIAATDAEIQAGPPELRARLDAAFRTCRAAVESEFTRNAETASPPHVPRLRPPDASYEFRDVTPEKVAELRRLAGVAGVDLASVLNERSGGIRPELLKLWQADDMIAHLKTLIDTGPAN